VEGKGLDLFVVDDVLPDPPPDPPAEKSRVERSFGPCVVCHIPGELVHAFDERVYRDGACPDCLLHRTSELTTEYRLDSRIMAPMVFVARALRGEEPFASVLRAADSQNPEKVEATLKKFGGELVRDRQEVELEQARSILRRQGFLSTGGGKPNNKQRRAAAAIARREARRALRAEKRKARGNGAPKKRKP
jgi:hypothetical protein